MSIFLHSSRPIHSSARGGFTLVELIVSVSIVLMILAAGLLRFNSFDSAVLIRSVAYDVAFSVREAQSSSLGVVRGATDFRSAFGTSFTPGERSYALFEYRNEADPDARPEYVPGDSSVSEVRTYTLPQTFTVTEICVQTSSAETCALDRLDVSFRRPEYPALFYASGYGGDMANIESATVRIGSTDGALRGTIDIGYAGHISVGLETGS